MNDDIKTKVDLYKRIRPAMYVKIKDIKRDYDIKISYEELFMYLEEDVWKSKSNLSLSEIVEDVLYVDVDNLFQHIEKRRDNEKNN